tara:strand:+ start:6804 stop:7127 length:324 start_codon:yes stop_codon:yes gene_type:complete
MHNDDQNSNEEDEELREIIEHALKENVKDRKTFKRKQDLESRLSAIISEYMDSYILLGYDFHGNYVDIKVAATPQKEEALSSFLLKYFAAQVNSIKGIEPPGLDEML